VSEAAVIAGPSDGGDLKTAAAGWRLAAIATLEVVWLGLLAWMALRA
jgi:hypothetical protein